jgi:hypothetical protein
MIIVAGFVTWGIITEQYFPAAVVTVVAVVSVVVKTGRRGPSGKRT